MRPFQIAAVALTFSSMNSAMAQERTRISSDWGNVTAELADNAAARSLIQMLPITIDMHDHLRQEKTGNLPPPLPEVPRQLDFAVGTLGVWGPDHFVIYYRNGRVPQPGIAIRGNVSRATRTESPVVAIEASTSGLVLVGKQEKRRNADGSVALGPEPWRTKGLDGSLRVKLDGAAGHTQVHHQGLAGGELGQHVFGPAAQMQHPRALQRRVLRDPVEAQGVDVVQRLEFAGRVPPAVGEVAEFLELGRVRVHGTIKTKNPAGAGFLVGETALLLAGADDLDLEGH